MKINKKLLLLVTLLLLCIPYSFAYGEPISFYCDEDINPDCWAYAIHDKYFVTDNVECATIPGQENMFSGMTFTGLHDLGGASEWSVGCDGEYIHPIQEDYWYAVVWNKMGSSGEYVTAEMDTDTFYELYFANELDYHAWTLPPFAIAMCYVDCESDGIVDVAEDFGIAAPDTPEELRTQIIRYPYNGYMLYTCEYPATGSYTRTFGCVVFQNPAYTDWYSIKALWGTPSGIPTYPAIQPQQPTNTWSNLLGIFNLNDCSEASDVLGQFWQGTDWIDVDFCTIETQKTFNVYLQDDVTIINETTGGSTIVNTSGNPTPSVENLDFTSLKPFNQMSSRKQAELINQMEASNLFIDLLDAILTIVEIIFSIIVLLFYILEISVMIYVLIVWVPGFFRKILGLIDHINGLMRGVR